LTASHLRPALVLGSGFHRHVFGDGGPSSARTLYDWDHLVSEVSAAMQVAAPSQAMPPVQRWETLLLRAAREGFRDFKGHWHAPTTTPAYAIEAMARRHVVGVINKASENYPLSARARIPLLPQWGAVISLNFDVAWLGAAGNQRARPARNGTTVSQLLTTHITSRERRRLCERINVVNSSDDSPNTDVQQRVWFPNGNVNDPKSIRMGLHDYGAAPFAIQNAFALLKQWERTSLGTDAGAGPDENFAAIAQALEQPAHAGADKPDTSPLPLPLTWVADFLYRPLFFAGVGLSVQESGLWWLLAQRARNLAKIGEPAKTYILVDAASDKMPFWRSRPFGVEAIACGDWDEGWERILSRP
jgi:hypothetical protein